MLNQSLRMMNALLNHSKFLNPKSKFKLKNLNKTQTTSKLKLNSLLQSKKLKTFLINATLTKKLNQFQEMPLKPPVLDFYLPQTVSRMSEPFSSLPIQSLKTHLMLPTTLSSLSSSPFQVDKLMLTVKLSFNSSSDFDCSFNLIIQIFFAFLQKIYQYLQKKRTKRYLDQFYCRIGFKYQVTQKSQIFSKHKSEIQQKKYANFKPSIRILIVERQFNTYFQNQFVLIQKTLFYKKYYKQKKSMQNDVNDKETATCQIQELKQIKKQQIVEQGWWNSTANWMKKKYFNSAHMIDLALNDQKSNQIWLFGMNLSSNQQARMLYNSVLWFTYRQNLRFYKIKKQFSIQSDVGWGCMIRVGQMMLAHCLRLNLGTQYFDNSYQIQKLLKQFIQDDGKFSVQKIAQKAFQIFGLKPGDWYSPSQIAHVLCDLQNQDLQSSLKVLVYDNQFQLSKTLIFLDQKRSKKEKSRTTNQLFKINSQQLIKISPGLIIILFRIGYKTPQKQMLDAVIKLLKQERNCIGILGGRPGKAHYLIGSTNKSFVYLDPHCVKQNNDLESFFCSKMFSIPHQNIDPSMGLCFYVKNTAQLIHLYDRFESQRKKLPFYSYSKCQVPFAAQKEEHEEGWQNFSES